MDGRSLSRHEDPDKIQPCRSCVRVELPAAVFSHLTDELYESKIVYRTEKFEDKVRTFCMNPYGIVVNENTNGIVTVNGHSYEDTESRQKIQTLHCLWQSISQSRLKTATDTERVLPDCPICWAAV